MMMEFGRKVSKPHSLIEIMKGCVLDTNRRFYVQKNAKCMQDTKVQKDLYRHTSVLIRQSKEFDFIKDNYEPCVDLKG